MIAQIAVPDTQTVRTGERQTYDLPAACGTIGFSENTGRKLIRQGIMPTIRVGRRLLIPRWWVDDVLAGRRDLDTPYDGSHADR